MHGSLERMKAFTVADPNSTEANSNRTALHKAAYWGHVDIITYLASERKANLDAVDSNGDSAMHDAARFGHVSCVQALVNAGANKSTKNNSGQSARDVASAYGQDAVVALL